jgi:hypothetical protein
LLRSSALIDELKAEHAAQLDITAVDVLREYAKQANSDIGDYVEFGSEDWPIYTDEGAPIIDEATGKQKTVRRSFVHLRDQSEVDTSLIKSVRNGRDGPVIELYDRQHAQDALVKALPKTDGDKQITKVVLHRHNRTGWGCNLMELDVDLDAMINPHFDAAFFLGRTQHCTGRRAWIHQVVGNLC